jgi:predicted nucleotidyltransferase component of viral defense system
MEKKECLRLLNGLTNEQDRTSMMYPNAISFRQALESPLTQISKEATIDLQWIRKQVAFDRLLARIFFRATKPRWLLKGGYAMELRFSRLARATKDMDLSLPLTLSESKNEQILESIRDEIQDLANHDLGDWFVYDIQAPVKELDAAPYGGARYPVNVKLAQRKFTNFSLDVGIGDVVIFEPEWIEDHNFLKFADIPSVAVPLLPREQQFAEKIHAYTLPREGNLNSRTRDLVDLVLLIEQGTLNTVKLKKAIEATFKRRNTHAVPFDLSSPPENWAKPYEALAQDCGVIRKAIDDAFLLLENFWNKLFT